MNCKVRNIFVRKQFYDGTQNNKLMCISIRVMGRDEEKYTKLILNLRIISVFLPTIRTNRTNKFNRHYSIKGEVHPDIKLALRSGKCEEQVFKSKAKLC